LATISAADPDSLTDNQYEKLGEGLGETLRDTMNTADSVVEIDVLELIDLETGDVLGPTLGATRRHRRNTDSTPSVNIGVSLRVSTQGDTSAYLRLAVEYNLVSAEFDSAVIKVTRMLPMYYVMSTTYLIGNGALNLPNFGDLALGAHLAAFSSINPSDVTSVQMVRTAADSSVGEFSYQLYVDSLAAYRAAQQITAQMVNRSVAGALDVNVCPSNTAAELSEAKCVSYCAGNSTVCGTLDESKKDADDKVMSSSSWVITLAVLLAVLLCLLPVGIFAVIRKRRTERKHQVAVHAPTQDGGANDIAQSSTHYYPPAGGAQSKNIADPLPVDGEYMVTDSEPPARPVSSDYLDPKDKAHASPGYKTPTDGNGTSDAGLDGHALVEFMRLNTDGDTVLEVEEREGREFLKLEKAGNSPTAGTNVEPAGADFQEGFAATLKPKRTDVSVDVSSPVKIAEKGEGNTEEETTTVSTSPTAPEEPDNTQMAHEEDPDDYINVVDPTLGEGEYRAVDDVVDEYPAVDAVDYLEGPLKSLNNDFVSTPVVTSPSKDGKKWWRRSSQKKPKLDPLGLDQWSGQKVGALSEADKQFVAATEALLDMDMDTETVGKLNLQKPPPSVQGAGHHALVADTIAAKFVTSEFLASLSPSRQQQLFMCCHGSLHNSTRLLGIHARSAADYKTYARIFANVVAEYHGLGGNFVHQTSWDIGRTAEGPGGPLLELLPATGIREATVKVKANRNFAGFPFVPAMTAQDRIDLEAMVVGAFEDPALDIFRGGSIYSLTPGSKHFVDDDQYNRLTKQRLMFKTPATPSKGVVSDLSEDWPTGRCCFVSKDASIMVWVGQEDHIRIIVQAKTTDYMSPYLRLQELHQIIETKCARFEKSPKFGHLTACPSKLGTAMSSQTCIDLPLLRDSDYNSAKEICSSRGVRLKRANAQHVYELSADDGLCVTEGEMISNVWDAMVALSGEFRDQTKTKLSARLS
jgi:hypothetical protein